MSASVKIGAGAGARPWWIGGAEDKGQWTQLPANVTAEKMLELAGIAHTVGKSPLFTYPTKDAYARKEPVRVPGMFAMIRQEQDGTTLPIPGVCVGEDYKPIQVGEAFAFGDDLLNASQGGEAPAHWHTAGELLDGTIWALAQIDKELYVAGDKIESYFLFSTKHDGKSSFRCKLTKTRVVCKNTLGMANNDGTPHDWSTRHTQFYQARMEEARRVLRLTTKAHAAWEESAKELLAVTIRKTDNDFKHLMDALFPVAENLRNVDAINTQRTVFLRVLGKPDLENVKETGWGIVNAAADYEQHFKSIRTSDQDKVVQTLFRRSFSSDAPSSLVTKAKEFVLTL
jgi:phage/plasmid-like protein (TIGR03299 family)